MNNIKLSELYTKSDMLTENQISDIIFDGIRDNRESTKYAIVFGSPEYQQYRIKEAICLYKANRVKKLILTGGIGRNTDESKNLKQKLHK